ncbi:hypothetical protein AAHE18_15G231700 [Arachis hypogaea]
MHDAVYKKYTMFNLSLLISPASLPCSHVFCNFCIVKSMKSSSDCPVCKLPFFPQEIASCNR